MYSRKYGTPKKLELKELPKYLKYVTVDDEEQKPIIINATLSETEYESLIKVLKIFENAIRLGVSDIKGISPSMYLHKIIV